MQFFLKNERQKMDSNFFVGWDQNMVGPMFEGRGFATLRFFFGLAMKRRAAAAALLFVALACVLVVKVWGSICPDTLF